MFCAPAARLALAQHAVASIHAPSARRIGVVRTQPQRAGVALTFDDGPHPEGTPAVLELLAAHGAVATFFLVGEQVRARPELARTILAAGHTVALHGERHRLQSRRRAPTLARDYDDGIATLLAATGQRPSLHRPPYGVYSPAGLALARERRLTPVLWSAWGKDWRRLTTPTRIAANALSRTGREAGRPVGAGDVILLHDADYYSSEHSHRRTAAALAIILDELDRRGLATVPVDPDRLTGVSP